MKPFTRIGYLLFPPRCAACGKLQRPPIGKERPGALCPDCAEKFEKALRKECGACGLPMYLCQCVPPAMKRAGITEYVKLVPYGEAKELAVSRRLVLFMKDHARRDVFFFVANELKPCVADALRRSAARFQRDGQALPDTVIAYLPRQKRTVRMVGHDQAKELARALSAVTGIPVAGLLSRVRRTDTQKGLSATERMKNLSGAFAAEGAAGLRVLLVDDVVTTGAGMVHGAKALMCAGAAEVLAVSVALTPKRNR